jgi:hypothetical protein
VLAITKDGSSTNTSEPSDTNAPPTRDRVVVLITSVEVIPVGGPERTTSNHDFWTRIDSLYASLSGPRLRTIRSADGITRG